MDWIFSCRSSLCITRTAHFTDRTRKSWIIFDTHPLTRQLQLLSQLEFPPSVFIAGRRKFLQFCREPSQIKDPHPPQFFLFQCYVFQAYLI